MSWACAFCGGTGERSGEHLIREAWEGLWPTADSIFRRKRVSGEISEHHIPKSPFDYPVNEVCQPCNGGWMNAIDTAAQPVLVRLANHRSRTLQGDDQRVLRNWAYKTAMVRTLMDRDAGRLDDQLRELTESRAAPRRALVQVALSNRLAPSPGGRHSWGFAPPRGRSEARGPALHHVQLGVGALLVQVGLGEPKSERTSLAVARTVRDRFPRRFLVLDAGVSQPRDVGPEDLDERSAFAATDLFADSDEPAETTWAQHVARNRTGPP